MIDCSVRIYELQKNQHYLLETVTGQQGGGASVASNEGRNAGVYESLTPSDISYLSRANITEVK